MDKPNLTIHQIKITLDTNIPKIGKPIELTRSILYYESVDDYYTLSNYPHFTTDVKYPRNYLNTLDYSRRVEFFFSNERFKEVLLEKSVYSPNPEVEVNDTIKHNVETMINVLFATKFPIINNYTNSYDRYILNIPNFDFTLKDALPAYLSGVAPHIPVKYSYLKINEKIYTNSKVIWLNDVINHPIYRDLINSYIIFDKWRTNKREQLVEEIKNQKKKLKSVMGRMNNVDEYIKEIEGNKSTSSYGSGAERNKYIDKLVEQIKKVYVNTEDPNDVYLKVEDLREIFNITTYNVIIPKEFKTHLKSIFVISKQIGLLTDIQSKYFQEEMNIYFEDDSDEMKQMFQTRFKDYIDFIKKIEKYNKPIIESENAELQEIIYGYTQGFNNHFPLYLNYVKNKYINKQPTPIDETVKLEAVIPAKKMEDLLYVGVNITENITPENPRYSIYLQVDLIGGEMNDSNKSKILCKYKGEHYGEQFMRFRRKNKGLNTYEVPKKRMYFDIDAEPAKNTNPAKNTKKVEKKVAGSKHFYTRKR